MMDQHYPLQAEARFLWQQPDGTWQQGSGVTRDIGRYGLFVTTAIAPAPGSLVQIIVNVPSSDRPGVLGQLCGKGVTVRTESMGFAAEVLFQPGWASVLGAVAEPGAVRMSVAHPVQPSLALPLELPDFAAGAPIFHETANHLQPLEA